MDDATWIKSLDKIHDPKEALIVFLEHEHFLGYDPYYRDLRIALLGLLERIRDELRPRVPRKTRPKASQARRDA